ncbi:DUF2946 domain-containing protein [Vagococcus sp. WN89Y]|uniref:DUF2946 domain-containing protein n=1 Tax=Vagococcus sp. WN89Y TaxID=3457258 RepID=UPI003FCE8D3C
MKNVFHQYAAKRTAAWLALFSILLILVAPQISTALLNDPMPGMQHEMNMPMAEHLEMPQAHGEQHETLPVDHAQACGYCVLLAHVPGLIFLAVLLLLGRALRTRFTPVRQKITLWLCFPWLCPDTRAPPRVCFSIY